VAVAHDERFESHTGTTGSASEASFSWSHNPIGVPRGVLVFVFTNADADTITSVTYDGVDAPQVSEAIATSAEPGRTTAFFLGASVPTTDPANVIVTRVNNATVMYAISETVTALTDTEVYVPGIVLLQTVGTLAEQNVDDGSPGTNSLRFAAVNSGLAAPPVAGANSTALQGIDFGTRVCQAVRETTAGQGSRPVGFADAGSDDRAAIHLAVREIPTTLLPRRIDPVQFVPIHFPNRW
jgi:hypothetical protein